ncbi:hypothetical protein AVEN_184699-1 [Araneus ventricosus]|uniref:Uncharacterized protein n=1 Tax=Araneus ventricosus TaxID=182803 RepID=A0A4Y2L7U7_ARAVE|nr:hypothetical protein AVEN_184699-1 [Araneus ventricosus]
MMPQMLGKQHRETFGTGKKQINSHRRRDKCRRLWSHGGNISWRCLILYIYFKDEFTKFRRVFFLRRKSEVVNCLKTFISESEAAGHKIKELLSHGGTEFNNSEV